MKNNRKFSDIEVSCKKCGSSLTRRGTLTEVLSYGEIRKYRCGHCKIDIKIVLILEKKKNEKH